jgi:hypothetical protein
MESKANPQSPENHQTPADLLMAIALKLQADPKLITPELSEKIIALEKTLNPPLESSKLPATSPEAPPSPEGLPHTGREWMHAIKQNLAIVSYKDAEHWYTGQKPPITAYRDGLGMPISEKSYSSHLKSAAPGFQTAYLNRGQVLSQYELNTDVNLGSPATDQEIRNFNSNINSNGHHQATFVLGEKASSDKKQKLGLDSNLSFRPIGLFLEHYAYVGTAQCQLIAYLPDQLAQNLFSQVEATPMLVEHIWDALVEEIAQEKTGKSMTIEEIRTNSYDRYHNTGVSLINLDQHSQALSENPRLISSIMSKNFKPYETATPASPV